MAEFHLNLSRSGDTDGQPQLVVSDQFDLAAMQAFRRREDIYWASTDALSPPPEAMDIVSHMEHPDVWTVGAMLGGLIFGYVEFNRRTSIGAEIHTAFHPKFRGRIAKAVGRQAITAAFTQKGLLKLWAPIPSDNRAALFAARHLGFREQGRLTRAIIRHAQPPLCDLVLMALSKEEWH